MITETKNIRTYKKLYDFFPCIFSPLHDVPRKQHVIACQDNVGKYFLLDKETCIVFPKSYCEDFQTFEYSNGIFIKECKHFLN